jgi:hypothetical protein
MCCEFNFGAWLTLGVDNKVSFIGWMDEGKHKASLRIMMNKRPRHGMNIKVFKCNPTWSGSVWESKYNIAKILELNLSLQVKKFLSVLNSKAC